MIFTSWTALVSMILSELDPIEASLPVLIDALEDPDRIVRIAAVDPVARFGKKAHAAIPILEKWLEDEKGIRPDCCCRRSMVTTFYVLDN